MLTFNIYYNFQCLLLRGSLYKHWCTLYYPSQSHTQTSDLKPLTNNVVYLFIYVMLFVSIFK